MRARLLHTDQFETTLTAAHTAQLFDDNARSLKLLKACGYEWIYLDDFKGWRRIKQAINSVTS